MINDKQNFRENVSSEIGFKSLKYDMRFKPCKLRRRKIKMRDLMKDG